MIGREKLTEETMIGRDVFQNISPLSASVHCSLCGSRSVSRWTSLQSKNVSMQCIMDGMRKCWSLTIRGRVVVDPSLSGSCAVRHYRSAYPPLNHIAIGIPESQSVTSSYWWETIFLLSAAPAADTAVMSETKGVRQLVAKAEFEKVTDLHIDTLSLCWIDHKILSDLHSQWSFVFCLCW